MVLVKADALNVVPRGGLVAEETLVDLGVRLVANGLVDHFEVH